jgi:hypothetical protein
MIFTLASFVLFVVFYVNSGFLYYKVRNPFGTLSFALYAVAEMFGLLLSYGFFLVFIGFVFTPLLMNWLFRLLGRLALRAQQFPKQQFINEMYEGALWLPHKVLSYSSLRSLDCV